MLPELLASQLKDGKLGDYFEETIHDTRTLLHMIDVIKSSVRSNDDDALFNTLEPFLMRVKLSTRQVLTLSHVFCSNCDLYVPSCPGRWVKNNKELFETDVYFFHLFFMRFDALIQNDIVAYPVESLYLTEDKELLQQTVNEKFRLLWTMIKNYSFIVQNMI